MEKPLNIFISYSWDNDAHKDWAVKLANYLIEKGGCDVTLDQYDLSTGGNMVHFMEKAVVEADKVLLILTPNYKLKADGRQGGVGMEYSMISQGLYTMQSDNKKFLPILRAGSLVESAPTYVQTTIYHDMTNDLLFDKTAFDLLRVIYDKPKLVKPKRGSVPDFKESKKLAKTNTISDGFAESAGKVLKARQLRKELDALYKSEQGVKLVVDSVIRIFAAIQHKASTYSLELNLPIHQEVYNNSNSLRLQAEDYFVIADYVGFTENSVRLISLKLSSGGDKYYQPRNSNSVVNLIGSLYKNENDLKFFPQFNDDKSVRWELNEIEYTEDDLVKKVFSLLLEAMSNEGNVQDHG
ncbi:toll/interleukin-1 receptor domain-containing protein [Olleya namhaensis]|uniref:toll/interleukin-1 receptor domain-containing protein n=1 Tax=Olleya namhaensis TaxID=1144750 RepID=UPI00248FB06C|nr:toll/interleukin-1 receptor domain-containing protein [Olleya namhaensis]